MKFMGNPRRSAILAAGALAFAGLLSGCAAPQAGGAMVVPPPPHVGPVEVAVLAFNDFHGNLDNPKLVLFVGGNYFFAMAPLVQAFEEEHPDYKGRLFWETIPPGLLVKQMDAGGTITIGNMTFTAKPDVFLAGLAKVQALVAAGMLEGPAAPYVTNTLTIMVPAGNPAQIKDLADLGQAGVKLAMPNPDYEGIARQIKASLKKSGGDALVTAVYDTKVRNGSTVLTQIHHRQTPLMLMSGDVQAGVTWQSEAVFQEKAGHANAHVDANKCQCLGLIISVGVRCWVGRGVGFGWGRGGTYWRSEVLRDHGQDIAPSQSQPRYLPSPRAQGR